MNRLSVDQRITVVKLYYGGQSLREIKDAFLALHADAEVPCLASFKSIIDKFNSTGSVRVKADDEVPQPHLNQEKTEMVLAAVAVNPKTSLSKIEEETGISRSTACRILRKEKFRPYKVQNHQELLPDDLERRIQFCEFMVQRSNENRNFLLNFCTTDESSFPLVREPNPQNTRFWATENPHQVVATRTQYQQKLNVWMGIFQGNLIGPFFIIGNLNGETYLQLLQNNVLPALQQLRQNTQEIIFQHDGCPAHIVHPVRQFLNEHFTEWIGRGGTIEWPPRSPDLAPCDFFLWSHLKNNVYKTKCANLDELRAKIIEECHNINYRVLANVRRNFYERLHYCLAQNGDLFEHLI